MQALAPGGGLQGVSRQHRERLRKAFDKFAKSSGELPAAELGPALAALGVRATADDAVGRAGAAGTAAAAGLSLEEFEESFAAARLRSAHITRNLKRPAPPASPASPAHPAHLLIG